MPQHPISEIPGATGRGLTAAESLRDLLLHHRAPDGHYDEVREATGHLRPHWAAFAAHAGATTSGELAASGRRIERQLVENGVTYNVHAPGGPPRAWSLDVLPHIVPVHDWERLAEGLRQRARLLEAIARDLYGPQRLVEDGLLPPALLGQRTFLRPCHGIVPPSNTYLHLLAFDVARTPDGAWSVIDTRTQAPSGAGYALENRLSISQIFPDAFRDQHVRLHAPFFRSLREMLFNMAPGPGGTPHVALLTPGPYSETYFEHAYLSRYLGFTLVEGADLTTREDRLYLKTVAGLRPVHALLRRLDDDFCDPLELRTDSTLGVAGLIQSWRAGGLLLANAPGMGVLESPVLPMFLPRLCERLLGAPLLLASPWSSWSALDGSFTDALKRLDELVIKSMAPRLGEKTVIGRALDPAQLDVWVDRLRSSPGEFVVEDHVPLSHAPVWDNGRLDSRAIMMRVFLVADGRGDYQALPGGLTRVAGSDRHHVSGRLGGGSKDTWVPSDRPVERVSLLPGRLRAEDISGSERFVSSRAAEHLFWMGRYAERSENCARLIRAVLTRLHDDDGLTRAGSDPIVEIGRAHGILQPEADHVGAPSVSHPLLVHELLAGITDDQAMRSVAFNVAQTVRVAGAVRDRLSGDNWRVLNQLSELLRRRRADELGVAEARELLDQVVLLLVAIGGLEMAHMTRDDGWRFMSMGRHLERLLYVTSSVASVSSSDATDSPAMLEWLLDVSDSIITYRARYMGRAEWLAVADLLLFDRRNPRSAAFQLGKLSKHVPLLPAASSLGALVPTLDRLALTSTLVPSSGDLFPRADTVTNFLEDAERVGLELSDALTLRYFSHVYEPAHALSI